MELAGLLREPESKTLEFKRDLSSLNPILKTVVAFANTAGGTLIIGRSAEGELLGVKDILKAEEKLANAIAENIRPPILPDIDIATIDGKDLLVVKVAHWKGPFYFKRQGIPNGVYIRLGSTSRPAGPELCAEIQRTATNSTYDEQPLSDLSIKDLDSETIQQHLQGMKKAIDLNLSRLKAKDSCFSAPSVRAAPQALNRRPDGP